MCVCCVCYVCYVCYVCSVYVYVCFRVLTMMTRSNRRYTNDLRPCTALYIMVLHFMNVLYGCSPALEFVYNCTVQLYCLLCTVYFVL